VRGSFVRAHGDEVLATVRELLEKSRRGELKPDSDEQKGPRDPNRRKREDVLKLFRNQKATERKVTPSVILPNPILDTLAAQPPRNVEELSRVPYLGEKRLRLYGENLLELLAAHPAPNAG
jgi:ribonuclease D